MKHVLVLLMNIIDLLRCIFLSVGMLFGIYIWQKKFIIKTDIIDYFVLFSIETRIGCNMLVCNRRVAADFIKILTAWKIFLVPLKNKCIYKFIIKIYKLLKKKIEIEIKYK